MDRRQHPREKDCLKSGAENGHRTRLRTVWREKLHESKRSVTSAGQVIHFVQQLVFSVSGPFYVGFNPLMEI